MRIIKSIVCVSLCLGAVNLIAGDSVKPDVRESLSHFPAAELPAKAAEMIKQTKASGREAMTIKVLKSALEINPAAAPAVVGAIARSVPDMAAVAAGTAAGQQPKQAGIIARAAATVAPGKAGKIVAAVCRAVPNDFRNIAIIVAQAVPGAGKEILEAVGLAIPDLKPFIAQAMAAAKGNVTSVAEVLDQSVVNASTQAKQTVVDPISTPVITRSARGPAVGPPYIPLSGTPGNVNPGNSGEVPTGGRGYAAP